MCGICGIYNYKSKEEINPKIIKNMTNVLHHRGPDGEGIFIDENVGLGFKRLSIINISEGHQPIKNDDNSIVAICNGEIFNYKEVRNTLTNKGHRFKTGSDCEVILHLYEEYKGATRC